MSRPRHVPETGDVAPSAIAQRLGMSLPDFNTQLPQLLERKFPPADPTTGNYCIEAVDRWRLLRHERLFPELTGAETAAHAGTVFENRRRELFGGKHQN